MQTRSSFSLFDARSQFSFAATLCVAVACCFNPTAVGQNKNIVRWQWTGDATHHEAVVQVSLDGAHGTGVVVHVDKTRRRKDGFLSHVLTANHVVEADEDHGRIKVRYNDGTIAKKGKILEQDKRHDIALIETWAPPETVVVKMATRPATNETYLEFAGLGGGADLKTLRHFSGRATQPTNDNIVYADATLLPGDSGGPVFNGSGELVGIISGGWFWWDGGATNASGTPILSTWPARASNVNAVSAVMSRITAVNIASLSTSDTQKLAAD